MPSKRRLVFAAVLVLVAGTSQAALFDAPIPSAAYITVAGNDWAWGYPVAASGYNGNPPADLSYQATQGWRIPTATEIADSAIVNTSFQKPGGNVPAGGADPVTGTTLNGGGPSGPVACAAAYFVPAGAGLNWCDYRFMTSNESWARPGDVSSADQLFIRPVPDIAVSLTGPDTANGGSTIALTATMTNSGLGDVISGTTTVTLPTGLTLDPAATLHQGCTASSTAELVCDMSVAGLGPIAASGGFVSVPIQARVAAQPPSGGTANAVAAGMIRDLDDTNDRGSLAITFTAINPPVTVASVPTLSEWGLGLMAALMVMLGVRTGRRR